MGIGNGQPSSSHLQDFARPLAKKNQDPQDCEIVAKLVLEAAADRLFDAIDKNSDGVIDCGEWMHAHGFNDSNQDKAAKIATTQRQLQNLMQEAAVSATPGSDSKDQIASSQRHLHDLMREASVALAHTDRPTEFN